MNGLTWSYYYDATNRRRLKVYPTGEQDEYFHDADSSLLVDVGVDVLGGATKRPTDEYVWLDGRPVLVVRGRMTLGYVREADSQVSCGRNGEAATCGAYFLVTDNLNKPAVILDGAGKVSAFVDFSAQGEVNAVPMSQFKTASPYAANSNVAIGGALSLTGLVQPPGLQHDVRINYGMVDTEGPVGAPVDAVQVKAYTSGGVFIANMGAPVGGAHRGHVTTPWMGVLDGGVTLNLRFTSNASNCPPTGPCSPATWPYSGVNAVNYEYRRREAGAAAFSTPLRFPGQYYDAETQKHENWNRFFDPSSGRYLTPEPLLQSPRYVRTMAKSGMSVPTYAYVANNPLKYVDANGLFFTSSSNRVWRTLQSLAANPRTGWMIQMMAADPNTEFAVNEVPYENCPESGGRTWPPFQIDAKGTQSIQIDVNLTRVNAELAGYYPDAPQGPWTFEMLVGHELGHGFGFAYGGLNWDAMAVDVENILRMPGPYRPAHDMTGECRRPIPPMCAQ